MEENVATLRLCCAAKSACTRMAARTGAEDLAAVRLEDIKGLRTRCSVCAATDKVDDVVRLRNKIGDLNAKIAEQDAELAVAKARVEDVLQRATVAEQLVSEQQETLSNLTLQSQQQLRVIAEQQEQQQALQQRLHEHHAAETDSKVQLERHRHDSLMSQTRWAASTVAASTGAEREQNGAVANTRCEQRLAAAQPTAASRGCGGAATARSPN